MSFIQRELDQIRTALGEADGPRYEELYAAQQALAWALEPDGIRSPYKMIMGTQGDSKDCLPELNPASS